MLPVIISITLIFLCFIALGALKMWAEAEEQLPPLEPRVYKSVALWIHTKGLEGNLDDLFIELYQQGHLKEGDTLEEVMISEEDFDNVCKNLKETA